MSVLRSRQFQIIIGFIILGVTGGSLVAPILPAMVSPLGASDSTIGLVLSVYTLTALVSVPFVGPLADRVGRRTVLVLASLMFGIAGVLIFFSSSFNQVLVLRAIQGFGVAGMMNTGVTMLGDLFKGKERSDAMGLRMSMQSVTNAIVPFLAGLLATISWRSPFLVYGGAIVMGVMGFFFLAEPIHSKRSSFFGYLVAAWQNMKQPKAIWVYLSNLSAFIMLYALISFLPVHVVRTFGLTTAHAGFTITVAAGIGAIAAWHATRIRELVGESRSVGLGFLSCSLGLLSISTSSSYPLVLLSLPLWGLGFGTINPALNTAAVGLATRHTRAGVMTVFTMALYLGQTLSPPLFGMVLSISSLQTVFLTAAVFGLLPASYAFIFNMITRTS